MTLQVVLREELYGWPAGDHALPAARSSYSSATCGFRNRGQPFRTDSLDGLSEHVVHFGQPVGPV